MNLFNKARDKYKGSKLIQGQRLTLKTVNKAIQAEFPDIELVKGEGYFYLVSNKDDLYSLSSTSIYVYKLNEMTLEQWLVEVRELMKGDRNYGSVTSM